MGAIIYPQSHAIDSLLRTVADRFAAEGWCVGGALQSRHADDGCAGMFLEDIRNGTRRSIAQNLGSLSTSCKLDSSAMADIAGELERQIDGGLDLLIINRFGKLEFDGGGLRSAVERAIMSDVPVLTGVRETNRDAWHDFHGGLGVSLSTEEAEITAWVQSVLTFARQT